MSGEVHKLCWQDFVYHWPPIPTPCWYLGQNSFTVIGGNLHNLVLHLHILFRLVNVVWHSLAFQFWFWHLANPISRKVEPTAVNRAGYKSEGSYLSFSFLLYLFHKNIVVCCIFVIPLSLSFPEIVIESSWEGSTWYLYLL